MAIRTVGPTSTFPTIAAAMLAAGASDTIQLETGYSNETATVTHNGMTVTGDATSTGIVLQLATTPTIATFTLAGTAPINVLDAADADGNGIVGNAGNNVITVKAGADAVNGGLGIDRLVVDYHLATGAVTGDSTSNFTEAGGGGRLVTITAGTFEHFTILTGSGADTITTGAGNDIINVGNGANTVTAGQGANSITGGSGADTITALDGGNFINGRGGSNTITSGGGNDVIISGVGADTIIAGGGIDLIAIRGGADTSNSGAGNDRLIVDYSIFITAVTGGVTGGNLLTGYTGHIADSAGSSVDFVETENFTITTGSGNDVITTGDGLDVLRGGAGTDLLKSGGGNDTLDGGAGNDTMQGLAGNDTYFVDAAGDHAIEAASGGSDIVITNASYVLAAGSSIELLRTYGSATTSAVNLTGNELANKVYGNNGANVLNGGAGHDTLLSAGGNDTFLFNTALGASNVDTIIDFNVPADTVRLENGIFTGLAAGTLAAGAFHIGAAAADASDRIIYNSSNGALYYDSNGNVAGGATAFAVLATGLALTNADFFVI